MAPLPLLENPVDIETLTAYFGGWSCTFTPLDPHDALHAVGARRIQQVADPLAALREADDEGVDDDGILLVATRISPVWTLLVETFGMTGFVAAEQRILEQLRTSEQRAATFVKTEGVLQMLCVEANGEWCRLDMLNGHRHGAMSPELTEALNESGFPAEGPFEDIINKPFPDSELAPRAIYAATGLELSDLDLGGVWLSGISRGDH